MVRLRCTLFGRLVRERRDRHLTLAESDFLRRHTLDCSDCRAQMHLSDMGLDALRAARLDPEPPSDLSFVRFHDHREIAAHPLAVPAATLAGTLVLAALVLKFALF